MASLYDMVRVFVSSAPGTGPISLGTAVSGYRSFGDAAVPNGRTVSYNLTDYDFSGNETGWEVGRGVYASGALSRGVLYSSAGGSPIGASGNAQVWIAILAEDIADLSQPAIEYVSTLGGPVSFSLPSDHSPITVCEDSGTYNVITVTDPGGALINNRSSFTQFNQPYASYTFRWNGSQWRVF